MKKIILTLALLFTISTTITSCREKKPKDKVEEAIEEVGDEVEDATDEVKDEIDDAS